VHFKENDLIIPGKREKLEEEEEDRYYRCERYFSPFISPQKRMLQAFILPVNH